MINIAINGFGRIGRNFLRAVLQDKASHKKIRVVVINVGPAKLHSVAHMFKYDTLMGEYLGDAKVKDNELEINGYRVTLLNQTDPKKIEWYKYGVDWVVDATGKFTSREGAQLHLDSGAKNVLITAPAKGEDVTIIPGVNDQDYNPERDHIVSLGSCTTNAIMPMLKVLHEKFVVKNGFMTTIHAYTNTQVLLDVEKKDLRRSRAAALNIIPTTTGATKVLGKVMPELEGLIGGNAIRVPVAKVSLIDLTFIAKEVITKEKINHAFEYASKEGLKGILDISYEPLVSSDYSENNNSVVIDGLLTKVISHTGKIFGWYDNEWGYSVRLKDFLLSVAQRQF
ncbi:type I glyceraldehyde-3-phosphate dehydrogenase [Candidatus Dependentiae bacterium]